MGLKNVKWAVDLGTTNTVVARYDAAASSANIVNLRGVATPVDAGAAISHPGLIPSAVLAHPPPRVRTFPGISRLANRYHWGTRASIGEAARGQISGTPPAHYATAWKTGLLQSAHQHGLRLGSQSISAQGVAELFLYELGRAVHGETGQRMHDVTFTVPVRAFEHYRASLRSAARAAGIRTVRFVDEPVAAAIGYGLSQVDRNVMVVDFGGGTLDIAVCAFGARAMAEGQCRVLAKDGLGIGGNTIDEWIVEAAYAAVGLEYQRDPTNITDVLEHRFFTEQARKLKESLCLGGPDTQGTYFVDVNHHQRRLLAIDGREAETMFTQASLTQLIRDRGFFADLRAATTRVLAQAERAGIAQAAIHDVLLVGGSTLLPDVDTYFRELFGRAHVRSYDPFRAVATGAAAFAAGQMHCADIIMHDYALVSRADDNGFGEPYVVVPAGSRYPNPHIQQVELKPQCGMGVAQDTFKMFIQEIGQRRGPHATFWRDGAGSLLQMGAASSHADAQRHGVLLNDKNPLTAPLNPPYEPNQQSMRLEATFGINADRWLVVTVKDKQTGETLMTERPVVELL